MNTPYVRQDHDHDPADIHHVMRDPVCGMTADPEAGKPSLQHDGVIVARHKRLNRRPP